MNTSLVAASRHIAPARRPEAWLWYVGIIRILMLLVIAAGALTLLRHDRYWTQLAPSLLAFYAFGLSGSLWNLYTLRLHRTAPRLLTWAQVLVDFCVVAATVSFTRGPESFFTFLFVIIILEAGLLLGIRHGFIFAGCATAFMLAVMLTPVGAIVPLSGPPVMQMDPFSYSYNFLIQALAYFLTASISGYWSLRVRQMQLFQKEILDNMNTGFLICNRNGEVTTLNNAAARVLGIAPGEWSGRPAQDILRVQQGDECPVLTCLRTRRDFTRYEFNALCQGGEQKLLGISTSFLVDSRGRPAGAIASFSDLTELANLRREMQRQDRMAVVGELAAGLAHEIRNPVAVMRGCAEEFENGLGNPPLAARLVKIIKRESDQLNHIVTEFLDFAREPRIIRQPIAICDLITEVCELLQRDAASENVHIIFNPDVDLCCEISGDRVRLKQAFLNVAKNSLEAIDGSGSLNITLRRDHVTVMIAFEDTGPGIAPDVIDRVFEPFFTTKDSGIGMGLSICMRIINSHDGAIHVAPRDGGGVCVTIRLPYIRDNKETQR